MSRDEPFDYRKRFAKDYQGFEGMVASRPSLRRLKLRRWRRQQLYAKLIKTNNKSGGPERDGIYSDIHGNELQEMLGIEGAIDFVISVRLTDKARALDVEIPEIAMACGGASSATATTISILSGTCSSAKIN